MGGGKQEEKERGGGLGEKSLPGAIQVWVCLGKSQPAEW